MKVMCIKNGNWLNLDGYNNDNNDPSFGEIVTVVQSATICNLEVYLLQEYPYPGGYVRDRFIPLSTIDETELIKEREEVFA